ncbi:hypothetical protein [Brevundimonas sp.]|uniref:hypothetical protein n=1 Tax=Brevundimonas sp. TaxID=1871086 RepID=UPI00289C95FE|nr:hypothetical protein [Brevundimonas sp.]
MPEPQWQTRTMRIDGKPLHDWRDCDPPRGTDGPIRIVEYRLKPTEQKDAA